MRRLLTNIDRTGIGEKLRRAVSELVPLLSGVVVDVGAGDAPYRPLIMATGNVDIYATVDLHHGIYGGGSDVVWDGDQLPFGTAATDAVVLTEVLEHCPRPLNTLAEVARILRPGGKCLLTVPFIWSLHDVPCDYYRYTPFALEDMLRSSGFDDIQIKAIGGWDASLAQVLALWVRRRPMLAVSRCLLSILFFLPIRWLYRRDKGLLRFSEGSLATGFIAVATKGG